MTNENNTRMPQYPEPYWRDEISFPTFPSLSENITVDVGIVGGGISGITTAYLLAKQGVKVAILEADKILNGTTGHTTAKITAQHDIIYDELINHFGHDKAKQYYQANTHAIKLIKDIIKENHIECNFSEEDAYLYATTNESAQKLQKEYEAYQALGIDGELVNKLPFELDVQSALLMKNQAQFHPLKFLVHLIEEIKKSGGLIFENTVAVDVDENSKKVIQTSGPYKVTCDSVVSCSHYPFYDGLGLYFSRMHAERSYIIGVKTKQTYPGGMYLSVDQPTRSLRSTPMGDETLILIGGESHRTGHGKGNFKHYEALESFGNKTFGDIEFSYRWSTQDLITLDKVPYVGQIQSNKPNIYIATGFRKWGMTNGVAAAQIITDLITKKESPYQEVYHPSRFVADPSLKEFIKQNAMVAGHFISGKMEIPQKTVHDLSKDEGAVILHNGERTGAYKNSHGKLHLVDTTCSHLGCEIQWNDSERTWDCPCHGSRFSIDGEVMEGPAEKPIKKYSKKDE